MMTRDPISPTARANARATPGQDPGEDVREDDAPKDSELRRTERPGSLLHLGVELEQYGLHCANDEGQGDEEERHHDRGSRERDVDLNGRGRPVEREERQARDDRRQREGQVDDGVDDALAAETRPEPAPRR